jgi:TorA maturation chaperone TorD
METEARILYYRLFAHLLGVHPRHWDRPRLADIVSRLERPGCLEQACPELERSLRSSSEEALLEEYHTVFVGLGRGEVLPYGSWYLSGELMGRSLVRLRSDLAFLGIERQPETTEPEDHAGCLLESMALLVDTHGRNSEAQAAAFFEEHIASWMERFLADLKRAPSAACFAAAAEAGRCFLLEEKKHWSPWQT